MNIIIKFLTVGSLLFLTWVIAGAVLWIFNFKKMTPIEKRMEGKRPIETWILIGGFLSLTWLITNLSL